MGNYGIFLLMDNAGCISSTVPILKYSAFNPTPHTVQALNPARPKPYAVNPKPTRRIRGLSKLGSRYLGLAFQAIVCTVPLFITLISTVTLFITLITKSHDPLGIHPKPEVFNPRP